MSFTITSMATLQQLRMATAVTGFSRNATGASVDALVQDITLVNAVAELDNLESEVVDLQGRVEGAFTAAGSGFEQATISTPAVPADSNYRLRLPSTLRDALDLVPTCGFALNNVPVGRLNAVVQVPAFRAPDIAPSSCPPPVVVGAAATSSTAVQVTMSRNVAPASVLPDGSQFTFAGGLTATAATVAGRVVTVTTSLQAHGAPYTVTVASSVTDVLGEAVALPNNASFSGF